MEKFKKIFLIVLLIALTVGLMVFVPYDSIRNLVQKSGPWGAVVYILLFTILPIGFFPVPALALIGGVSFGLVKGSIYTVIGAAMNCLLMFVLSRRIGHDYVVKMINEKFSEKNRDRILNAPDSKLFTLLFICRLIPIIPYNLINYGFGLTNISLSKYMFASVLGIIPGTLVYLNLGDKVLNVGSKEFYQAIILVVGLTVVSLIMAKIIDKKDKKKQKDLK
ncbi:hypothetical protein B9N51_07335 [Finegoldia magna]|uniref:TVP38/TMEM64 family protein n=1 Tax=Finegoldia magna TaxID=1260 RepID=UPI000B91BE9F|nr:TVP38/TMEM64 family protein [Finegoldia magna]OXZ27395.1 hypothetical protein B9N51_07335 [Finegoldia magna]